MFLLLTLLAASTESIQAQNQELPTSQRLAPLYSALAPGTGELIRGYNVKGEIFLWFDGITVAGVAGFGWDALGKRNAAISSAVLHAGANPSNKTHRYLVALEGYNSLEVYNCYLAREARSVYEDDLKAQKEYIEQETFPAEDAWVWESDSLRLVYLEERNNMRRSWRTSQALMGLMLLTRIASVFDVGFFSPPKESRLGIETVPDPQFPGVQVICRF
ncbi:hypothetical protein GF338_05080 [candidate division WOR-3 bacterium]|nr:hypothetical protein [candidate division WOR-3 bacterium]